MDTCINQKAENLHNFPENFELQFYKIFREIKKLGCDYFYFLGSEGINRYRLCTYEDWLDFYHTEKLVLNDPLKRIAEETKFTLLPWEQLTHINGSEKRAMDGRSSFGLFNGLTMVREHQNKKYIFALATESKDHDLARYFFLEKMEKLEEFFYGCMRLFDQYTSLMASPVASVM